MIRNLSRHRAAVLILSFAALAPSAVAAQTIYDDRPVVVRPGPHVSRDCPTCYEGHDFGRDCFQNVWNGFQNVWTNVCRLGWH